MNIKTWISDLSYASTAVNSVKQATTTTAYANAVKNLSLRQAELALSTKNLSAEQQREILVTAGLIKETGTLTVAQATEALTTDTRNAADVEALMLKAGLITELGAETTATITVDAAKLKELVDTKVLTQAEAELLAMKAGVTLQSTKEAATLIASNAKLGSSFVIMGKTAGAALKGIGTGLLSFASAHPLIAALVGVVSIVGLVTTGTKKLREEQEQAIETARSLQEEYRSSTKSLSDNISSLESQKDEFERLSKGVDDYGKNISLSSDEYDRYKSIVAEILGYSPELIQGYDAEGNAIANKNSLIERSIELMKEEQRQKLKEMTTDEKTGTAYEGAKAGWEQTKGYKGANTRNEIARWFDNNALRGGVNYEVDIAEALGIKDEWKEEGNNLQNAIINNIDTVAKNIKDKKEELLAISDRDGNAIFSVDEINAMIEQADTWQRQYSKWQQDIEDAKHGMDDQFELYAQRADGYNDLTDAQKAFVNEYIKATGEIVDAEGNLLSKNEIIKKAEGYESFVNKLADSSDVAQEAINKLFALDINKMSATDYENQVGKLLQIITKELNLSQEELEGLIVQLGFDVDFTKIENLKSQLRNKFGDEFNDVINELSLEELEIASKLKFVEGMTPDDLRTEIDALSSRDITIDVKVNETFSDIVNDTMSKTQSVVDSTTKSFEGLAKVQEAVANGYKLSTTAALELAKSYPEILNGATTTADGQMKLNKEVVDAVLSGNQAQLDSAIDKQIGELEAEKVSLEAKKQSAITGLQIVEAALMAEDAADKQKAIEKIKTANEVLDEMIKAGYSETEANRIACDVMSGNTTEYDRIAKEVAQNADSNFSISAKNIADNVFKNMKNAATSVLNFGKQCWESAKAFLGIGSKDPSSPNDVMGGSGGTGDTSDDYKLVDDGTFDSFDGSSIEDLNLQLDELKLNLQDTITGIDDGLSAIDGQISALNSLKIQSNNRDFDSGDSKKSGGSGSDKNSPEYTDPTDAIIDRINLKQKELAIEEERLENEIELAEASGDNKKQISLTNDLIATRKKRVDELNTANAGLHQMAEDLRNSTPQWNEEEWFNSQGEETEAYNSLYNSSSKEEQEKIKDQFEKISKIKEAWVANDEELVELNKELLQDAENLNEIYDELANSQISDIEHQIELNINNNGEDFDNRAYYKQIQDIAHAEANRLRALDPEKYKEQIQEWQNIWWDAQHNIEDWLDDMFSKANDFGSSVLDSRSTLLQSYYDVTNSIAEAQHNINKELEASKTMYEYLDEDTRKLLFNQEDYNVLCKELIDIQSEADRLQRQYEYDLKHSTLDTIEEITSNYEMQYETLMKSYEIAKADLEIAKKKQKLDNVLNERNVRMRINGEWQYVAKTQDVIDAQSELADAEYAKRVEEAGLTQQESINNLTKQQNELTTVINKFESGVISLDEAVASAIEAIGFLPSALASMYSNISQKTNTEGNNSSSGSSSSSSSSSGRILHVGADGKAPSGAKIGDTIRTAGGDYKIVTAITPGAEFNSSSGHYSIKIKEELANGTRSTLGGATLLGEEGFEAFIDNNGHLIPINQPTIGNISSGGIVFNQDQMTNLRSLWDLSNIGTMPSHNISSITNRQMSEITNYQMYGDMIFDGNNPEEIFKKMADFFKNTRYKSN